MLWKDGGPVIGIQIENEYGNRAPNGGEEYLLKLKSMAIEAGLDVPVYTVTGWDNAVIPTHAFVPVYGGYPDEPWSGSTHELKPDPQGVYQFHVATPVGTAGIMQGVTSAAEEVQHSHYPRSLEELLSRERFYEEIPNIDQSAHRLRQEYERRYCEALDKRATLYTAVKQRLIETQGWGTGGQPTVEDHFTNRATHIEGPEAKAYYPRSPRRLSCLRVEVATGHRRDDAHFGWKPSREDILGEALLWRY